MHRVLPIVLIFVLGGLLAWMTFLWEPRPGPEICELSPALEEAPQGGGFTLQSYRGAVSLEDFRGQVVLLYFGYTWCPDICPTSLGLTSLALEMLAPDELARVQGLFVSVDPERDSPQRLKEYAEYFHPKILGVTGSKQELDRVTRLYGAAYRKVEQATATDYVVDHSADTYLIDTQGRLVEILPHGTEPDRIVAAIRKILN
jgi:protein SCO1/2